MIVSQINSIYGSISCPNLGVDEHSKLKSIWANALSIEEDMVIIPDSTEPVYHNYEDQIMLDSREFNDDKNTPLELILRSLQVVSNQIAEWSIDSLLPELFDFIIDIILTLSRKKQIEPYFSFKGLYELFEMFGLRDIRVQTLNRISNALLWKNCTSSWVDIQFCRNLHENLSRRGVEDVLEASLNLLQITSMMEIEEQQQKRFIKEVNEFLSTY